MKLVRDFQGYVMTPFGDGETDYTYTPPSINVAETPPTPDSGGGAEMNTAPPGGSSGSMTASDLIADARGFIDAGKQALAVGQDVYNAGKDVVQTVLPPKSEPGSVPPLPLPKRKISFKAPASTAARAAELGPSRTTASAYVTSTVKPLAAKEIAAARTGSTVPSSSNTSKVIGYGLGAFVVGKVLGFF